MAKIKCPRCGISVPDVPEDATEDEKLCNGCNDLECSMDEETYVDKEGEECPFCRCGGELNVTTQFDVDVTTAHRNVKCGHCNTEFREYFHLAGFEPIEP